MADTIFTDWLSALTKLQSSVSKDLAEIREQKAEIQKLKTDIFNRLAQGKYVRDDRRLVLSAPEIIIGNVDASGMLYGDGGSITIRGQRVATEGVGENGVVSNRAATISQIAVDPGPDGIEEVVRNRSVIVNQAKNITIQSNGAEKDGYFACLPQTVGAVGVRIHADQCVEIDAAASSEVRSQQISDQLKNLNSAVTGLTLDSTNAMTTASTLVGQMEALLALQDPLSLDEVTMRTTVMELDDLTEQFNSLMPSVYQALDKAVATMSKLAETKRRIKALQNEQTKVSAAQGTFKDQSTDAVLRVNAEQMFFKSVDGDGNIRTNPEAAISIQTGKVDISTLKPDGSLIDDSHVNIATHDVSISTVNSALNDDGTGDFTTEGSVSVSSKDISFMALDYSSDSLKAQTKDSCFSVRMENMVFLSQDVDGNATGNFYVSAETEQHVSADKDGNTTGSFDVRSKKMALSSTDKDNTATGSLDVKAEQVTMASVDSSGKAIGQLSLNSKDIFVKSMDTDDKGADKSLAAGGNMVLVSEKMFVGRTDKDNLSKELQLSSEKTGIYGKTTAEVQQGEAKAVVQLDGGNVAIGASKAEFYGDNTVNGKSDFKGDVTMKKLTADNIEAKTSLKSKNISDGIAVPGGPSSAKLSAKLKEADAPKAKTDSEES
jgi:hypothetical protein